MIDNASSIGRAAFHFIDDIEHMSDRHAVMARFGRELSLYGFHAWLITGLPHPGDRIDRLMMLNGWPAGWSELYTRSNLVQHDPVVAFCFRSRAPFAWSDARYDARSNPRAKEVMDRAIDFRMKRGFCVPIHSADGFQAVVTVAGEQVCIDDPIKRALHLMALYAHAKAADLCAPRKILTPPLLTRREREVLQWTANGKTSWEISQILGLAESTVTAHIKAAAAKLDTPNRVATVVTALRRGEITL